MDIDTKYMKQEVMMMPPKYDDKFDYRDGYDNVNYDTSDDDDDMN